MMFTRCSQSGLGIRLIFAQAGHWRVDLLGICLPLLQAYGQKGARAFAVSLREERTATMEIQPWD